MLAYPQAATAAGELQPRPYQTVQLDCPNNPNLPSSRDRTALRTDRKQAARCVLEHNPACGCVRDAFQRRGASHLWLDVPACLLSPAGTVQDWLVSNSQDP